MTKRNQIGAVSSQPSLFDSPVSEGCYDLLLPLKHAMNVALRKIVTDSADSRWQVAARISEMRAHTISKEMLDQYVSDNVAYRPPADLLTAFCVVTNSLEPFRVLLQPLSCEVTDPTESEFVKLARLEQKRSQLDEEIVRTQVRLGIKPNK